MKKVFHLFSKLTDSDVDWISAHSSANVLPVGTELIAEGTQNDAVYLVLEGSLVVRTKAAGQVGQVDVGEVIGEMSLVDGRAASATVVSVRASRVLTLGRDVLESHLERDVGFSSRFFRGIAQTLSERLRFMEAMHGKDGTEELDEIPAELLGDVHVAGARFDRLVKATLVSKR